MPSLSAEEAPKLKPYMALAEKLGSLVGQLAADDLDNIAIEVEGAAAELNIKPITGAVLAGFMRRYSDTVNMVNAPYLAKERGLDVREVRHDREGDYHTLVRVSVNTSQGALGCRHAVRQQRRAASGRDVRHQASKPSWKAICSISSTRTPGLHRPGRHAAGRKRHQHRHVQPRPPRMRAVRRCCCCRSTARSHRPCSMP
jgi:hypothetical protein